VHDRRSEQAREQESAGNGRPLPSATPAAAEVLRLQSTAGNRAVQKLLKARTATLQRDLSAFEKERSEVLPSYGESPSTTMLTQSAEAAGLRAALAKLIEKGKIKMVTSSRGKVWFAANHHKNAQLDEVKKAFEDAGYKHADKLARALHDIHGEYLWAAQTTTSYVLFWDFSSSSGLRLWTQRNRSMTEWEIRQARRVFGDAIDYTKVEIRDGSIEGKIGSVGGYARTIGNTIHFPDGGSRDMAFMVHELTHVWQYQKKGWTYAPKCIWAQITEGYSYSSNGKSPEDSLKDARSAGTTLTDFNMEQQGDILSHYYARLQKGSDVSAYQPFANDVR
jgi:Domain of unknown function (DUF4157)